MIETIYVEEEIYEHPRTLKILSRFKSHRIILIKRFSEIFNHRKQNFPIQKINPALILARKHNSHILEAPKGFGIGGAKNYYFSHMYNCVYDCRYCFLQGMYSSANYVIFVNYEDFDRGIELTIKEHPNEKVTFFSGYDCDSLALENITGFVAHILPLFEKHPTSLIEFRTKSIQIKPFVSTNVINNCIIAYSLMPELISRALEHRTPCVKNRIEVMSLLAELGWMVGLRFDPLIHGRDWKSLYKDLIEYVFGAIPHESIHSVSFGPLRFPKAMYRQIFKLYPDAKLFAGPLDKGSSVVANHPDIEAEMAEFCRQMFANFIPESIVFRCMSGGQTIE